MARTSVCVYGKYHTYKTTQFADVVVYQYERTGKPARLITTDLGGVEHISELMAAELLDVVRVSAGGLHRFYGEHGQLQDYYHPYTGADAEGHRMGPRAALRALSRGSWFPLREASDGRQVLTPPNAEGNVLTDFGCYGFEGLTTAALLVFGDMVEYAEKTSEDVIYKIIEVGLSEDSLETFAGPARSHYGSAQSVVLGVLRNIVDMPVDRVFISAHESKGKDKITQATVYGTGLIGQAATDAVPPMVGDMFHLERYELNFPHPETQVPVVERGVRAHMQPHRDDEMGFMWPAEMRVSVARMGIEDQAATAANQQRMRERWPDMFIQLRQQSRWPHTDSPGGVALVEQPRHSIAEYLKFKDEELVSGVRDLLAWKQKVDERRRAFVSTGENNVQAAGPRPLPGLVGEPGIALRPPATDPTAQEADPDAIAAAQPANIPTLVPPTSDE
jgi:hypothetical protein